MPHDIPLITTIVFGLGLAFIFGTIANRLRLSPLVGYLVAGVVAGPATPGFVADMELVPQLAEIGIILLMFGVGLHFSLKDLLSVRAIAVPGAVVQILVATLLGMGLAFWMGWSLGAGIVFGLALSVASTVVLLRALQERRMMDSSRGRIAVGWLIVEDLAMVLALVLIPALSGMLGGTEADGSAATGSTEDVLWALLLTVARVSAFVVIMLVVGRRVIPWLLHLIAHTGSRELFRLGVLAIALGVAYGAATLFGVSFALGAFFAGMVLAESALSQQAAQESLPLRDAFAVLFFVSVGMLFDPAIIIEQPLAVIATVLIIVVGKSVGAYLIVLAFGHPSRTALIIAVSLAQIGEFSFILAALGTQLELLPPEGEDLILAGAIISILINPFLFWAVTQYGARITTPVPKVGATADEVATLEPTTLTDHFVVVGHGRVGSIVATDLANAETAVLVLEENNEHLATMSAAAHCIVGNGVRPEVLAAANLTGAKALFVAIPGAFEAGQVVRQARAINPDLPIAARAHSDPEELHLRSLGANVVIMGEREIARGMLKELLDIGDGTTAPTLT